jgi:hypothetical protein
MSNETAICNIALGILKAEPIINYDTDTTTRSIWCRQFYPTTRDAVLRAYPWGFAIVRKALAADPTSPIFGFDVKFALPDNPYCLRVLELDDGELDWKVEGRYLLCDNSTVSIKYISRVVDTTLFEPMFTQALATRMAAVLCKPITGSTDSALWQLYASMVQEGQTIDGMEGTLDRWDSSEIINVRY